MEVMLTNIENKISEMKIKESKKQVLFQKLDIETIERLSKTMTGKQKIYFEKIAKDKDNN